MRVMKNYVDGFVLPIPKEHLEEYTSVVEAVAEIWKEHGALEYHECIADDLNLEGTRSFPDMVGANEEEIVVFGWVVFDSKESRDIANKKVASDPRMSKLVDPLVDSSRLIFNASRMAYGGFKSLT